jgi:hypothetical protein
MSESEIPFRNVKCGMASFVANYIAGLLHPFDVIKTRFQSKHLLKQAMMERAPTKTLCQNTGELSTHFKRFIDMRV